MASARGSAGSRCRGHPRRCAALWWAPCAPLSSSVALVVAKLWELTGQAFPFGGGERLPPVRAKSSAHPRRRAPGTARPSFLAALLQRCRGILHTRICAAKFIERSAELEPAPERPLISLRVRERAADRLGGEIEAQHKRGFGRAAGPAHVVTAVKSRCASPSSVVGGEPWGRSGGVSVTPRRVSW